MRLSRTPGPGLGLDFGTSNSLAARVDGEGLRPLTLEGAEVIMPTATYLDRDFKSTIGQAAIDAYIEDNRGRTVELIPEVIGKAVCLRRTGARKAEQRRKLLRRTFTARPWKMRGCLGAFFEA